MKLAVVRAINEQLGKIHVKGRGIFNVRSPSRFAASTIEKVSTMVRTKADRRMGSSLL
jgi:hypothetical protein